MKVAALLDSSVLYSPTMRSVLMYLSTYRVYLPLWSKTIEDEWTSAVLRRQPHFDPDRLKRTCALMNHHAPQAMVAGYEPLIAMLKLPDPNDRHVLAAAIHGGAKAIVTLNLRHFPKADARDHGIEPIHPDRFVLSLLDADVAGVLAALAADRARFRSPPIDREAYLVLLARSGLKRTAAAIEPNADLL